MTVTLCGFPIENVSMSEAVDRVADLAASNEPRHVTFMNAHYVNVAAREAAYDGALRGADLMFADGSGMKVAGRLHGVPLVDNVNGTDMFPLLALELERRGASIFLLGGRPGIAEGVTTYLSEHAPDLEVRGFAHGYRSEEEWDPIVSEIARLRPDVLLVAMGAPLQDVWIQRWLDRLGVPVVMAVGGLFDFYSGRIPRAPRLLRAVGMEWVFRLLQEPSRMWRRYLIGNFVFLFRALRETLEPVSPEHGT